jgi:uncharacterized delta-60 repeat protein
MRPFRLVSALLARIAALAALVVAIPALAAPGDTDLIVKTHIANARNEANAIIVQPDGKYLTAGYARFGTLQFTVTRYNANGTIDTAFGDNGTLLEPIGSGDSIATAVALQADGKIVVAGYVTTNIDKFAIARFDSTGHLDTSFGGGGAATPVGAGNARGNAIAVQGDGKILVAGFAMSGGHKVFAIARYTTGAALDGTFGSGGIVLTPIGGGDAEALSMVVQGDGKIVVGGTAAGAGRVARYTAGGTLDATFGGTGIVTPAGFGFAYSLAMQPDGKVIVGGTSNTNAQFIVGRLTSTGAMDTAFASGGTFSASYANGGSARGLVVQSDGKIVAGGQAHTQVDTATGIVRLTSTGALDATFGSGGVVQFNASGEDLIRGMAITPDGRYVLAGATFPPTMATIPGDELIERFTSAGAPDTAFNGSGFRETDLGSSPAFAKASAIQSDGKIVVAGYVEYEQSTLANTLVLARYNADGSLDAGFGTGGLVLPAGTTRANAVAIQGDGKIVTAGFNRTGSGQTVFQVVRFNVNGSLDTSFNGSGIVTQAINAVDDEATSIAIQGDGKIVVGGMTKPASFYDSAFMRFLSTGALDTAFGSGGIATVAMSTGSDHVSSIALQADGKIVGAGSAAVAGGNDAFGVLRLMPNGTVDGTFGTGGFTTTSVTSFFSDGFAVAVQADGKIVVGGLTFNGSTDDFAVVRYNANGTLDGTFGTGGKTVTDMGNHNRIFALQLLGDGKIAVAGEWAGAFAAGLYTTSGTLDTTFGTGGTVFLPVNFNAGADHAWSLSIQGDGKWVLAGDGSGLFAWARILGENGGTVTKANPAVGIASSANPSNAGQAVTFTATVSGSAGTPTGTVGFLDGSTAIAGCSAVGLSAASATCTTSALLAGSHSITASYSGDAAYNAAGSAPLGQAVQSAGPGALALSRASIDFGGESMGTSSPPQSITVTNTSGTTVSISGIAASSQFAQSSDCSSLAPGGSCTISVTFDPAPAAGALNSTVAVSGTVTVSSNAPGSPNGASLAGTAEKSLVTHYYRSILRRAPDSGGKAFWQGEAARVASLGADVNETWYAMALVFYGSGEYAAFGRDDAGFVTDLYNTFFNRAPDADGLAFWTGQIASGMPRGVVLVSFMFSAEFQNFSHAIFGNTAVRAEINTVVDFYRGILARLPDDGGFNFWLPKFRTAQCQGGDAVYAQVNSISQAFLGSAEYAQRNRSNAQYVDDMYDTFLRRGGDLDGVKFWIGQLDSSAQSRDQVRQAFVNSPEFNARVQAIVNQGCVQ